MIARDLPQLLRYAAVGAATNAAGYLAYLLLTWAGTTPKATMSALYVVGASLGFVGHRRVTFGHHGNAWSAAWRYALTYAAGWCINFAMLAVAVDRLGWPHQLVQAAAIFVVAGFLFVAMKFVVFPGTGATPPDDPRSTGGR